MGGNKDMVYFIRRFLKGQKQSGTQDIWSGDEPMTDSGFSTFSELFGEGKYLMCVKSRFKTSITLN